MSNLIEALEKEKEGISDTLKELEKEKKSLSARIKEARNRLRKIETFENNLNGKRKRKKRTAPESTALPLHQEL